MIDRAKRNFKGTGVWALLVCSIILALTACSDPTPIPPTSAPTSPVVTQANTAVTTAATAATTTVPVTTPPAGSVQWNGEVPVFPGAAEVQYTQGHQQILENAMRNEPRVDTFKFGVFAATAPAQQVADFFQQQMEARGFKVNFASPNIGPQTSYIQLGFSLSSGGKTEVRLNMNISQGEEKFFELVSDNFKTTVQDKTIYQFNLVRFK